MRTVYLLAIAAPLLLSSCSQQAAPDTKAAVSSPQWPKSDVSTPDNALRSYWAKRDALRKYGQGLLADQTAKLAGVRKELEVVMVEPVAREFPDFASNIVNETFSRDILEVKVETGSRAVVIAVLKNTTPIPQGAQVDESDERWRRDGFRYKYVLLKDDVGWRVAEIWEWEPYQPHPDWRKRIPLDTNPGVPSRVYGGV